MAAKRLKSSKSAQITDKVTYIAGGLQTSSSQHVNKYLKKRAKNIVGIRRFMVSWLALVLITAIMTTLGYVQLRRSTLVDSPKPGGVYIEGMVGEVNNLNPLFVNGSVDNSVNRLIFNGLVRYDTRGRIAPDLAKSWRVADDGQKYIFTLKDDITWHDGEPFTASDVVFTVQAIQNPLTRSNLFSNWNGITVTSQGNNTVTFELPGSFAPFLNALTLPILPEHLLKDIDSARLRTASFNASPIGTGPFQFQALRTGQTNNRQIELTKNNNYFRGSPKLDRFIIRLYENANDLSTALKNREITAAVDLNSDVLADFETDNSIRIETMPLNSGVYAFFKTTSPLLKDTTVRQALVKAINRQAILQVFESRYAPLKTPLLPSQLGFDKRYSQTTNIAESEKILDKKGWKKGDDGVRQKGSQKLAYSLVTVDNPEYKTVATNLKEQWSEIGVDINIEYLTPDQLQQSAIAAHLYDILLYSISIGQDPDVYAYWHSSQIKTGGVNFSEWSSPLADTSLDIGRTRYDNVLRQARYKTFMNEWLRGAPAVALYQPRFNYAYHQNARGFVSFPADSPAERLTNVQEWTVNTRLVEQSP